MDIRGRIVAAGLLVAAAIHLMPVIGVLGAVRLESLYGLGMSDPSLQILMRHRAVLFGLLGAFLLLAAFRRALQGTALLVAAISIVAFLVLAWSVGDYNAAVGRVVRADLVALLAIAIAAVAHWTRPRRRQWR
jgi:hypothetical protein